MVRHKTRWLLVRFDFQRNVTGKSMGKRKRNEDEAGARQSGSGSGSGSSPSLTRKDISQCIRNSILSSFGIASAGMAQDLQVRLYDESTQLAIIRVSRDSCGFVRAAITFLSSIQGKRVVASVLSVNGSARTVRRVALLETRRYYRQDYGSIEKRDLMELEERLNMIRKIE